MVSIAADNKAPAAPNPAMTAGMNHHGGRRRDGLVPPRRDLLRVMKRLLFPDGGRNGGLETMRQERTGGARARWRDSRRKGGKEKEERGNRLPAYGRTTASSIATTPGTPTANVGHDPLPSSSGSIACMATGLAWARAFNTTLVVAGLKAEPVNRLDGGPRGASALNRATLSDSHNVRMNNNRPAKASFLYGAGVIRDAIPSLAVRWPCAGRR